MSPAILPFNAPPAVREVIEASLRLFGRSVLPCLPLATIGTLLGQLPSAYDVAVHGKPVPLTAASLAAKDGTWWALYALGTVVSLVVWALVLQKQQRIATGSAAAGLPGATFARFPAIVGYFVASFVVVLLVSMPFGMIAALLALPPVSRATVILLPILAASAAVSLGWPALIVDGRRPIDAVATGLRLAIRHWRRLVLVVVAILATLIVMVVLAGFAIGLIAGLASPAGAAVQGSLSQAIVLLFAALAVLYLSAFLLVVFDDLRARAQASSASNVA
ncbi:MAG: hypothetical protein CMLOHMNK_02851 [Steroidobacteraceae bacterium]|nr:hypothetical protein [Steroidobacteraceae bacterium]